MSMWVLIGVSGSLSSGFMTIFGALNPATMTRVERSRSTLLVLDKFRTRRLTNTDCTLYKYIISQLSVEALEKNLTQCVCC